MWSDKKYVDYMINILLFAVAINLFHYGQFILPVICLILFVDHRFQLRIRNTGKFIVLCLFAVFFFLFSYKLGFYSVMGFCLPMAYYIGSNLKENTEENIQKLIYLLAFGMAAHMILNLFVELSFWYDDLSYMFNKPSHYDIWTWKRMKTTLMSTNYILIMSCAYYLFVYEKNRIYKWTGILTFILSSIYCVALGRRTTVLMSVITLVFAMSYNFLHNRKLIQNRKVQIFLVSSIVTVFTFSVFYVINLFGIKDLLSNLMLFRKFEMQGLYTERIEVLMKSIRLYPKYLFGGQQISSITNLQIHDLWGDIYDYAGIVPYVLMICFCIMMLQDVLSFQHKEKHSQGFKLLTSLLLLNVTLQLFLEPVMTGSSLFLICSIMAFAPMDRKGYKL